jgi:uncharacterized protein YabE (DUF348 family)
MRTRLAQAAVVAVMSATAVAYGALEKTITIRVDGREQVARTFAATVGEALGRAGVRLGARDRVLPPLRTRLREGAVIEVRRAKPITLLLNGQPRQVIVTALTVQEVIRELRLRASLADFVDPALGASVVPGMVLVYREAVGITVVHDGTVQEVVTNAPSVGQVLADLGVTLGPTDRVTPPVDAYPTAGTTVQVVRVGDRVETETREVPPPTILRLDPAMERGERAVRQPGRSGLLLLTFRSTYEDGRRVARRLLSERLLRAASPRVVAVGTGPRCVCARGTQTGDATWYRASGLIAAHRTLPFGTVVRVTNLTNGRTVTVTIRDRGPVGEGRIIDLSDDAFRQIAGLEEGVVPVRIRW